MVVAGAGVGVGGTSAAGGMGASVEVLGEGVEETGGTVGGGEVVAGAGVEEVGYDVVSAAGMTGTLGAELPEGVWSGALVAAEGAFVVGGMTGASPEAVAPGEELVIGSLGSVGRALLADGSGSAAFGKGVLSGVTGEPFAGLLATVCGLARLPLPSGPKPPGKASTTTRNS